MAQRVALINGALPPAISEELRSLGCGLWHLPPLERDGLARLMREIPSDFLVVSGGPDLAETLAATMQLDERPRILVASNSLAELGLLARAVDLVISTDVDRAVWILAFVLLERRPRDQAPAGGASALLPIIDLAHRGFRALENGAPDHGDVRRQVRDRLIEPYRDLLREFLAREERHLVARGGSSLRVGRLCRRLGERLGLPDDATGELEVAGSLRDIAIHLLMEPAVLASPDPFVGTQRRILQLHPSASAAVVEPGTRRGTIAEAIADHHERLDGSGYPEGKTGNDIALAARILATIDVFEALVHRRPHRPAVPTAEALSLIEDDVRRARMDGDVLAALTGAFAETS